MKRHVYEYDEVVVGNNLASLFYCYKNLCPLLFKEGAPPFAFDFFEKNFPFEDIFFVNELNEIRTPNGDIVVGRKKLEIYNQFLFLLSAAGLMPFSDKIEKIRLENGQLKIAKKRGKANFIKFNKLRVFTPDILEGIKLNKIKKQKLKVLDTLKIVSKKHNFDLIQVGDCFVNKIHFVDSKKRKDVKHIIVVSFLEQEEVESFDFSIVPLKYKLESVLAQNGIQKRDYNNNLNLDFIERRTYNQDIRLYENENVLFDTRTEKEVCLDRQHPTHLNLLDAYLWRLHHLLLDSNGMIR